MAVEVFDSVAVGTPDWTSPDVFISSAIYRISPLYIYTYIIHTILMYHDVPTFKEQLPTQPC